MPYIDQRHRAEAAGAADENDHTQVSEIRCVCRVGVYICTIESYYMAIIVMSI